ncbi:hypothetical protein G6F70_000995 [Rhizopus microsporus]|nr:hypothetical protein G6F71_004804 [Rhizopus microsporus]KAG1203831.1 hypothetical protein G6F70_000995 [Rhizopus microsporus]KAG1213609.1 hypothetical protein G6F69_002661 [Rhizopus microsporus]
MIPEEFYCLRPSHDLRCLKKTELKDILMKHGVHYGLLMKRVKLYRLFKSKRLSRRDEIVNTYYAAMENQSPINANGDEDNRSDSSYCPGDESGESDAPGEDNGELRDGVDANELAQLYSDSSLSLENLRQLYEQRQAYSRIDKVMKQMEHSLAIAQGNPIYGEYKRNLKHHELPQNIAAFYQSDLLDEMKPYVNNNELTTTEVYGILNLALKKLSEHSMVYVWENKDGVPMVATTSATFPFTYYLSMVSCMFFYSISRYIVLSVILTAVSITVVNAGVSVLKKKKTSSNLSDRSHSDAHGHQSTSGPMDSTSSARKVLLTNDPASDGSAVPSTAFNVLVIAIIKSSERKVDDIELEERAIITSFLASSTVKHILMNPLSTTNDTVASPKQSPRCTVLSDGHCSTKTKLRDDNRCSQEKDHTDIHGKGKLRNLDHTYKTETIKKKASLSVLWATPMLFVAT